MRVVYTGAHGGFDTSRIPLGGGAAVMDALAREWSRTTPFDLTILGVGEGCALPGVEYVRLPIALSKPLTDLDEMGYARFCRQFERATTEWLRSNVGCVSRMPTVVLVNDISEGPSFREVAALGLPMATIFHVDVVEYVAKFYGRGWITPERLTQLHRGLERMRCSSVVPDVVRLIFEKQGDCVRHSAKLVVPSRGMADVLGRCYPGCEAKVEVVPWGAIQEMPNAECRMPHVRAELGVADDEIVLLTLCRLSPEKGVDRLLEALVHWERRVGEASARRVRLLICGAPAYMQGLAYEKKLHRLAASLRRVRVQFAGHASGDRKRAFFQLAHLYVHLSYHESYGLTIAEAMREGCPVLTTDHHSARDLVPADCGRIVSGRTEETVSVLRELLSDRTKLRVMGAAAAAHGNRLDFSRAAARLADLCIRNSSPGPGSRRHNEYFSNAVSHGRP